MKLFYLQKRFFRKIFFLYSAALIICSLAFCFGLFRQDRMQNQLLAEEECQSKMNIITQILDDKFMEIEKIGLQISTANWAKQVCSESKIILNNLDYFKRRDICQEIERYQAIVRTAKSTALLLPKKQMAIDKISFWEAGRYFASVGIDEEDILAQLQRKTPNTFSTMTMIAPEAAKSRNKGDFFLLKQLDIARTPELVLFFYVDGKQFSRLLLENSSEFLLSLHIMQGENSVFSYQSGNGAEEGGFSKTIKSKLYNWSYAYRMDAARPVSFGDSAFLWYTAVISFVLSLLLAYFLSRISYSPVSSLLKKLESDPEAEKENEFETIEKSFHSLREEKNNLERLSDSYCSTIRNNLLFSLLQGSFHPETTAQSMDKLGLPFCEDMQYLAAILDYPELVGSEQRAMDFVKLTAFGEENNILSYWLESADQNFVLIVCTRQGSEELFRQVNQYRKYCIETLGYDAAVFCGLPHRGLIGISKSYQTAKEQCTGSPFQNAYYYPIDWEIQLISQLRMGNEEVVVKILEELRKENLERGISLADNSYVTTLILETLLRIETEMHLGIGDVREEFHRVSDSEDASWPWDYLKGFSQVLCRWMDFSGEHKNTELGPQIIAYVNENFSNSSLSQQDIADQFQISRSGVSKIFKNTAKVNFIDYLHLLRIQKAKALFDSGALDVLEVARSAGYENEITFKRAFLRFESITPRKYMQNCRRK